MKNQIVVEAAHRAFVETATVGKHKQPLSVFVAPAAYLADFIRLSVQLALEVIAIVVFGHVVHRRDSADAQIHQSTHLDTSKSSCTNFLTSGEVVVNDFTA